MAIVQFTSIRVALATAVTGALLLAPPTRPSAAEVDSCNGRPATLVGEGMITGTDGDDVIVGSDGPDLIYGGGGNDIICSLGGSDRIESGGGDDWVDAGPGNDLVYGDSGNDILTGGSGDDILQGGAGDDQIFGRRGSDEILGDEGSDELYGGSGDDDLSGGDGPDRIEGGIGNDWLWGDAGLDELIGNIGDDVLIYGVDEDADEVRSEPSQSGYEDSDDLGQSLDNETIEIGLESSSPDERAWFRAGMPEVQVGSTTLWVSPNGSDRSDGSQQAPLRTIQIAVDRAEPGTTIYMMNGTWDGVDGSDRGRITFGPENSGQEDAWIRLTAAPGATPRLQLNQGEAIRVEASFIEISGLTIEGRGGGRSENGAGDGPHYGYGILITNRTRDGASTPGHHVVITGNDISGFSVGGIAANHANWVVAGENYVHHNSNWGPEGGSGISFLERSDSGGRSDGKTTNWITNNTVHANKQLVSSTKIGIDSITDGNCITLDRLDFGSGDDQETLVSENIAHSCGGRGINVFKSSNVRVERNLTWHNGLTPALSGEMAGEGSNILWSHNTVVPSPGRAAIVGDGERDGNDVLDSSVSLDDAIASHFG